MIKFYVVRHGQTLFNKLGLVQGWCNSALTEEGIEAAQNLGRGMKYILFDAAYCSTLYRTKETILEILKAKGQSDLPISEIEGLREACFGDFESQSTNYMWNEVALYLGFASKDEMNQAIDERTIETRNIMDAIKKLDKSEMAEDYETLRLRTQSAFTKIAKKEVKKGSSNVLIVSHGMSILGMLQTLGGDSLLDGHLDNTSVCEVDYENGYFEVKSMGDLSYMKKGKI